ATIPLTQAHGVVVLTARSAEVSGIQTLGGVSRQELLALQLNRTAPVGIERGVHHASTADELVQAEGEERPVIAACLGSALTFRDCCDQQQVAEGAACALLID